MKEYDIFLPLFYNDGRPVEPRKFQEVQDSLLAISRTYVLSPAQSGFFGKWAM